MTQQNAFDKGGVKYQTRPGGSREIPVPPSSWVRLAVCNWHGLALVQTYYRSLEKHLSLRVSIELWRIFTVILVDVLLVVVVVIGYLALNPDIMADIKMAVPFYPITSILFSIALVLRLFHGGHDPGSKNFLRAIYLMFVANVVNIVGFTFVAEAPSGSAVV